MTIAVDSEGNPVIQVNGRYRYVEADDNVLGKGAFGTVFIGHDNETDHKVAIKKVPSIVVKPEELRILQQLDSDFVVGLRDDDMALRRGSVFTYMIMDLLDTDLHVYLTSMTSNGTLDLCDLDVVAMGLANGYLELFKHDVIHRDIKPHNILLTYNTCSVTNENRIQTAKLSDFGISRVGSPTGSLMNIAGSPSYMAPEVGVNILENQAYDAQVDMWSIGVVLNECITGQVPFDESAMCRMFLKVTSKCYGDIDLVFPESTPKHYQEVVRSLLQLNPKKRTNPEQFHKWAYENIHLDGDQSLQLFQEAMSRVIKRRGSISAKVFRYLSESNMEDCSAGQLLLSTATNAFLYLCFGSYNTLTLMPHSPR